MTFYTYGYLTHQNYSGTALRIGLIIVLLLTAFFVLFRYLRNRTLVKYRDLSVILLMASALVIGFQFQSYSTLRANQSKTSTVVGVLKTVAKRNHVAPQNLQTNATAVNAQMLIRNAKTHQYYRVLYNSDSASFITEKLLVQMNQTKIKVVGD